MNKMKKGTLVTALTARSKKSIQGKVVASHSTAKGVWVEIKPAEGKNFKTRESLVTPVAA